MAANTVLFRRAILTRGATAGLGIGIAVASVLCIVIVVLLILHFRQRKYIDAWRQKHNPVANEEKHSSITSTASTIRNDKPSLNTHDIEMEASDALELRKVEPEVQTFPRRQKSIKDRLMGPLYRDSQADLPSQPMPAYMRRSRMLKDASAGVQPVDSGSEDDFIAPANARKRDTVHSFSSRRATRLMMYM